MVKKFTIPFASQGDANDIPDALQVDGKVSFTQGFGYDYERPYDDPQAKDIAREDMNGLFKAITSAVGELQTLGASEWSNAVSYPKGAIVYYEKDLYISQVDDNQNTPPQNWVSITSIANDSLKKAANLSDLTSKVTARNNLGLGSSATLNKTDVLGTSTNLVATQKLVNDTKINLESSKQDKLTFTGTGNVARMSEVDKKMDIGDGGWLLETATKHVPNDVDFRDLPSGSYSVNRDHPQNIMSDGANLLVQMRVNENSSFILMQASEYRIAISTKFSNQSGDIEWAEILHNKNISQSTGSSTTNVMSQKAVTDRLNAIESGHGLGYGQKWVDVTSQRTNDTYYTNATNKPIVVIITSNVMYYNGSTVPRIEIDGVLVDFGGKIGGETSSTGLNFSGSCIVPPGSKYKSVTANGIKNWYELR